MQLKFKWIQPWSKWRRSGVDISNSSKVIAFSNIGLQKFKMAAGGQDGRIFWRRLAPASTVIGAIGGASPKPGNGEGCVKKGIRRKILASALVFWITMDNLGW
jgi:hypothetical protein